MDKYGKGRDMEAKASKHASKCEETCVCACARERGASKRTGFFPSVPRVPERDVGQRTTCVFSGRRVGRAPSLVSLRVPPAFRTSDNIPRKGRYSAASDGAHRREGGGHVGGGLGEGGEQGLVEEAASVGGVAGGLLFVRSFVRSRGKRHPAARRAVCSRRALATARQACGSQLWRFRRRPSHRLLL